MRTNVSALACLLLCCPALLAQSAATTGAAAGAPQTTLSVNARLVTLPVVVRDKKDKIVSGLTKDDFTLTEDGRAETIRYFSLDTNLPLTLALNVDTSGSMREALEAERTASQSFLDDMVSKPTDKAAVLHFDREVELLEDLTSSKPRLNEALNQLGPTPADNDSGSSSDPGSGGSGRRRGGTQLYDSIYLSASELLAKQSGRKAIIVLSDGEDRGSKETLQSAVEAAQKAEAEVYTIYFKGEENRQGGGPGQGGGGRRGGGIGFPGGGGGMGYPGGGGMGYPGGGGGRGGGGGQRPPSEPRIDGKKIMQQIAGETGGRYFEAKKKENFDEIYKQIAEELRHQYMLGYTPDTASQGEGFHRIALTTKKKDLYVQTRAGYYGKSSSSNNDR